MTLRLNGDNSGFTEIKAADTAGDNSIKLPASNGSANQLLQNGGTAGELQYTSAGGGLHYDSSGRLLVGTSTARSNFFNSTETAKIQLEGTSGQPLMSLVSNADATGANAALIFGKTRGTAVGATTIVQNSDNLGRVTFQGSDGTEFVQAADIHAEVDGTPSTDVMPGKLVFSTNAGSSSPTPRMEIGSNGALKLLSGCPGIDFSGIQAAAANGSMTSETLDSYEEGTWTPTVEGSSGATGQTYANQTGRYTKVGRFVFVNFSVQLSVAGTLSGSTLVIANLPFPIQNLTNGGAGAGAVSYFSDAASALSFMALNANPNTTTAYVNHIPAAGAQTVINSTSIVSNTMRIDAIFSYIT